MLLSQEFKIVEKHHNNRIQDQREMIKETLRQKIRAKHYHVEQWETT